jgi:hypothetical protein
MIINIVKSNISISMKDNKSICLTKNIYVQPRFKMALIIKRNISNICCCGLSIVAHRRDTEIIDRKYIIVHAIPINDPGGVFLGKDNVGYQFFNPLFVNT